MATWISVLCRSNEPVTYGELDEVICDLGFADEPVKLDPPVDDHNRKSGDWGSFHIEYRAGVRPIVVHQWTTKEEMEPAFSDLREKLEDVEPSDATRDVVARIEATKRVFVFEIPGDPPEDIWTVLSVTEGFLARERDGIVVAEEAIYDRDLKPILTF